MKFPRGDMSDSFASVIRTEIQACAGFDSDVFSRDRERAMNRYFMRPQGDEKKGRAHVVSGDVSAMVEATLAQMMEAFTQPGNRLCDFDPLDADDEDQAQLESDAVHYYVMGRENGALELMCAVKEALLLRNGVVKVDAVDKTKKETRRLGSVEPDAIPALVNGPDVTDYDYDPETGELHVTTQKTTREFELYSVSLENFVYFQDWHKHTLQGIPVCAERHVTTRGELMRCGYDKEKVNALSQYRHPLRSETMSRDPQGRTYMSKGIDHSTQLVEYYEVYAEIDSGDGIPELRRIILHVIDGKILANDPVSRVRLAAGTCILNPHRFTGVSLDDKLAMNQQTRTGLRRALMDNVNAVNKARLAALEGAVYLDDIASPRVNNTVRVKDVVQDVRQAVMPVVTQDSSANILANLESTARERSEMGGAALDLQTANMQIGGDGMGSQGLDRAYSVAESLSAGMMKTIAATLIRDVYLLAHATLREFFDEPLRIKRNGKWQEVIPAKWPVRESVTIKPGMSPGERARRADAMAEVVNSQMMLAERGMDEVSVDLYTFNRALLDYARLKEVQNPEQYYIDPDSDQAQAALRRKQALAQKLEMDKKALMQDAVGLEKMRTALAKYQGDADREVDVYKAVLSSEVEEAKIVGSATADLIKTQREGNERTNGRRPSNSGAAAENEPAVSEDS